MTSFFLLARFDPSNNAGPLMEHLAKSSHSFVVGQNYDELARWAGLAPGAPLSSVGNASANRKKNKGNIGLTARNEAEESLQPVISSISLALEAQERVSSVEAHSTESEPLFSSDVVKEEIIDDEYEPFYLLGEKTDNGQVENDEKETQDEAIIDDCDGSVDGQKKMSQLVSKIRRIWQCPVTGCGASIPMKSALIRHVKEQHPGERPFWCKMCPLKFDREDNLRRHEKQKHAGFSGEKKRHANFTCISCDVDFASATSLCLHQEHFVGLPHAFCKPCQKAMHLFEYEGHQEVFHKEK